MSKFYIEEGTWCESEPFYFSRHTVGSLDVINLTFESFPV